MLGSTFSLGCIVTLRISYKNIQHSFTGNIGLVDNEAFYNFLTSMK